MREGKPVHARVCEVAFERYHKLCIATYKVYYVFVLDLQFLATLVSKIHKYMHM